MLEYCGEDGEICVDTMVGEWLIFFGDDPESAPALDELWPNVPGEILDEVRRRLATIDSVAGFFSSGSYNPDSEMIDLSVLKPGYRPIPGAAYELVERLDDDNSGFGAVWRGRNDRMQRDLVFKFCKEPLNESSSQTLHNELRLVRELDHPSIVKLQDECLDAQIPFLIYEYVDGVDLSKLLAERFAEGKSMLPDEAAGVVLKIADIISHAHTRSKPIVHRDLKPQNILVANHHDLALLSVLNVTPDLRLADLKVMDFGIGGHCSEGKSNQSMFSSLGAKFDGFSTRLYGSPQQCEGLRAERSDDVYALGVLWYQLLVGSMKKAPTGSGWRRGLVAKGMSNEQIDVLEGCLEQERENRITDAVELLEQIRNEYPLVGSYKNYSTVLTEAAKNASDNFGWDDGPNPRLGCLSAHVAEVLSSIEDKYTLLDWFESLSLKAAAVVASWDGKRLSLDSLKILTEEAAATLAGWNGDFLIFRSLNSLTPETAYALSSWKGRYLTLDGLTNLTPETANALSSWNGRSLTLDSLTNMTPETAASLACWKGERLSLSGLTILTPETAASLACWKGEELALDGLTILTPETAAALTRWRGNYCSFDSLSLETVKLLIAHRSTSNDSLLHISAENGGCAMAYFLIKLKTKSNQQNHHGWTPLLIAIVKGHIDIAKLIIRKNGADGNQSTPIDKNTPLHLAAKNGNAELVELLLHAGVDPAAKNTRGETALHCAVESGNIDTIRLLVPKS